MYACYICFGTTKEELALGEGHAEVSGNGERAGPRASYEVGGVRRGRFMRRIRMTRRRRMEGRTICSFLDRNISRLAERKDHLRRRNRVQR